MPDADPEDRYEVGRRELGRSVRRHRKARAMTMRALADEAGLSFNTVVTIEHGHALPSLKSLDAIATALGTTSTRLLRDVFPWDAGAPRSAPD